MNRCYFDIQVANEKADGTVELSDDVTPEMLAIALRQQVLAWGYTEDDIIHISVDEDFPEIDFVAVGQPVGETAEEILGWHGWCDQKENDE